MAIWSRREVLAACAAAAIPVRAAGEDPWAELPKLLERIRPPAFRDLEFDITRYGAKADGKTDASEAIKRAIDTATSVGGGRVIVPEGVFLTGPIRLRSNVNLHLREGATLRFSQDTRQYPNVLTRFEGLECMNYSPLVYAFEQTNIAVTGLGTLDGQSDATHWWPWKGRAGGTANQAAARAKLIEMAEKGTPVAERVFGEGGYLRPMFVQPYRSTNVLIEGITIINSPMYEVHPVLCRNVTVRNVKVSSHGPNNDGCDPESCSGVLIENCLFDTGDDCIAIKSGRNADGRRLHTPSENIIVQGCTMKDGHGGVTMGSECSGGIRNVYAQDCKMDSPNLDRILRFKNNAVRGGVIENVFMRNVEAGQVSGAAIDVDFYYEEGTNGPFTPVVRHVRVSNLTVKKSRMALSLRGFANAPVEDIQLDRCSFEQVAQKNVVEHVRGFEMRDVKIGGQAATAQG